MRYDDPAMGPRILPVYNNPMAGKVELDATSKFCVDISKNKVSVTRNGSQVDIGSQMVYMVLD